jgi:hypothetical protein
MRILIGGFFLVLMTCASAQTLSIQSILSGGNKIELSDNSIWRVEPIGFTPCMSCYIQQNWTEGDIVELVPKKWNYGSHTHAIKNYKDNVQAAVNEFKNY